MRVCAVSRDLIFTVYILWKDKKICEGKKGGMHGRMWLCGRAGNGRNPGIGQRFVRSLNERIEFDKAKTHIALRFIFVPLETAINLVVALQFRSNARRILAIILIFFTGCKIKKRNLISYYWMKGLLIVHRTVFNIHFYRFGVQLILSARSLNIKF